MYGFEGNPFKIEQMIWKGGEIMTDSAMQELIEQEEDTLKDKFLKYQALLFDIIR